MFGYRVPAPNEALLISGRKQRGADALPFKIVTGHGAFVVPILLSAYAGGLGPGLLATAIAVLGTDYFFLQPTGGVFSFAQQADVAPWTILIVTGVLVSVLSEGLIGAPVLELVGGPRMSLTSFSSMPSLTLSTFSFVSLVLPFFTVKPYCD